MKPLLFPILHILSDGRLHSGEKIAAHLQCSRSTVSRQLRFVSQLGLKIQKLSFHGYKWKEPIIWLNQQAILEAISIQIFYFDIIIFESIDSTNTFLIRQSRTCISNNRIPVIVTELQTKGRGRHNRPWYTGLGEALTFSLMWRFDQSVSSLSGISLVTAIALVRVLRLITSKEIKIKWPNDLVYHYRKLAGILIELRGDALGSLFPVIGVGINFNLSEHTKNQIKNSVTDITSLTGVQYDRNIVLGKLLSEICCVLKDFSRFGFSYFKNEWLEYHIYEGKNVQLLLPSGEIIEGTVEGVNNDGAIQIVTGSWRRFYNVGEISLCLNKLK